MRIYFLSEKCAALKLNGAYAGLIGAFEKFTEIDVSQKILAEVIAEGALPISFFIDGETFKTPPPCTEVYLSDGDAVIYISRFTPAGEKLKVLAQGQVGKASVTLFREGGGIYLSCDGEKCNLYELSRGFENAKLENAEIGGKPVLLVEGDKCLCVISEEGKRVFYNPAESWSCGERLAISVRFNTCADCVAECEFAYDGKTMTLTKSVTRECAPPAAEIAHFAFFQSVLTHADYEKYLCEELKKNAGALPAFLGEFIDVTTPYARFFERHGDIKAAGLVYPLKERLYEIRYFAVDMQEGKITNIYEVED